MRRSSCNRLPAAPSRFLPGNANVPEFIETSAVPPRSTLRGTTATDQLADDMRLFSLREGGATRDGLKLLGWTGPQLDELGEKARVRAQELAGGTV